MQINIGVQKYSEDEWVISSYLDGNIYSDTIIVMAHDAGLDYHENGVFPIIEDKKIKKVEGKIQFTRKEYGNYDILTNTLKYYTNYAILRYDLRNHGGSLIDCDYDRRDFLYERNARDLESVVDYIKSAYSYKNFIFIGTGISCLIIEYYLIKYGFNENVLSCIFISPSSFSFYNIKDSKYPYLYERNEMLNKNSQFNKIRGIYEGEKTLKEAMDNIDIESIYAKKNISTLYLLNINDKMVPIDIYIHILDRIKSNNIDISLIKKEDNYGNTDHGFYDSVSCDKVLEEIYYYIKRKEIEYDD